MTTIFYEKIVGNNVTNNTKTFDEVYGDQSDGAIRSFKMVIIGNGTVYMDHIAYQMMNRTIWNGKRFADLIPVLPKLPPKKLVIGESCWKPFPDNTPEISDVIYKCHLNYRPGITAFMEMKDDDDLQLWVSEGVYEFCRIDETDTYSNIPNPQYEVIMAEREQMIADFKEVLKNDFDGFKIVPMCYVPYAGIPDGEGWKWYLNSKSPENEIPVEPGKYPKYKWVNIKDGKYNRRAVVAGWLRTTEISPDEFVKKMLSIK